MEPGNWIEWLSARAFRTQGVEGCKAEEDRAQPLSCGRSLVPVGRAQEGQGVCIEPLKPRCGRIVSNPLQPGAKTRRGRQRHEGVQRGKITREILDNLLDQEVAKRDPAQARLAVITHPSPIRKSQSNQPHDGTADFFIRRWIRARLIEVRPQTSNVPEEATKTASRLTARLVSRPQLLSTRQRLDIGVSC